MISFFGNYYGGLVVKNLEKVFYMICGVALVFVGIIIGGLLENNADAQTESEVPEYKVVDENFPNVEDSVQDQINHAQRVQEVINKGCQGGYIFHQMVVTKYHTGSSPYDTAADSLLIFKKK